jgi:hypothetical protein
MTIHVPLGRAERIAMEIRRAEAIRQSHRAHQRFLLKGLAVCFLWTLAGLVLLGLSFHLTNLAYAELCFYLSFAVGYGGMFFTVVGFYVRGRELGEFD